MNFKLKFGATPNLGDIVNAVRSVNSKRGDVILTAEDVGADKSGTAQEFANQAALNLENEVNELKKLIEDSGGGGDSWNWVSINEIGSTINPENGLKYTEDYFIDGVGGIQFCIKDNILWIRALYKMLIGISGTGWPIFSITDPRFFPKLGDGNQTTIRPAGHQLHTGSILNQFIYYAYTTSNACFIYSAQSIPSDAIISILPTPIGFI